MSMRLMVSCSERSFASEHEASHASPCLSALVSVLGSTHRLSFFFWLRRLPRLEWRELLLPLSCGRLDDSSRAE
eukprot:7379113-Prymnesium_polylepis.2